MGYRSLILLVWGLMHNANCKILDFHCFYDEL